MYTLSRLYTCLVDVVGFRQNNNPDLPTLDSDLLNSESGHYFDQEHPLVDLEVLHAVVDHFSQYEFDAFDVGKAYAEGERTRHQDVNYEWDDAIDSTPGDTPPGSNWITVDLFNPFLRNMRLQSIGKVLSAYQRGKQTNGITKSHIDRLRLYDIPGRMTDKETRQSRFVGFEIDGVNENGLLIMIHRLGTQFDTIQGPVNFYVYHHSSTTPIYTITVNINKQNSFEWHNIVDASGGTLDLSYFDEGVDTAGPWYLGYFEDDFTGMAIIKKFDWEKGPCNTCGGGGDYKRFQKWTKYITIRPFIVPNGDLNGSEIWDISKNIYVTGTNFGLNLDISVKCDLTDLICTQRSSLADAISKQFAVDIANEIVYSKRLNRLEERQRKNAIVALTSDGDGNPGLVKGLQESIESLSFDLSALGNVCIPCQKEVGIEWESL